MFCQFAQGKLFCCSCSCWQRWDQTKCWLESACLMCVWPQFYLHWIELNFWNRIVFYLSNRGSACQTAIYQSPGLSPGLGLLISEAKPKPIASPHWGRAQLGLERPRLGGLRAWGPAQHITKRNPEAGFGSSCACLWQIRVVCAILNGEDVITTAPTGSRKSLTYWQGGGINIQHTGWGEGGGQPRLTKLFGSKI